MMAPLARLAHSLSGRKRVKIDEMRGDAAYFAMLEKELAQCPGVVTVTTNPQTGTALISHATEDASLWEYADEHELFHFGENEAPTPTSPHPAITAGTRTTEHKSYTKSGKRPDIRWLIFLGMMGMGVVQTIKGNIAIPAIGAFWYAFSILPGANIANPEHSSWNEVSRGILDSEMME
jgi:hypothetical protein